MKKIDLFYDPFKPSVPCCPNKITISLSFDVNLDKMAPILGKIVLNQFKIMWDSITYNSFTENHEEQMELCDDKKAVYNK